MYDPRRKMLPIGMGGGGGINYLFQDYFTTARVAGAVDNTPAEPGIATRQTVETDGSFEISSDLLVVNPATTPAAGELGLYYDTPLTRQAGLTVEFRARRNGLNLHTGLGFFNNTSFALSSRIHVFQINGTGVDLRNDPTSNGVYAPALIDDLTFYTFKIVLESTGCSYYINDQLVGSGLSSTISPLYVGVMGWSMALEVDHILVYL